MSITNTKKTSRLLVKLSLTFLLLFCGHHFCRGQCTQEVFGNVAVDLIDNFDCTFDAVCATSLPFQDDEQDCIFLSNKCYQWRLFENNVLIDVALVDDDTRTYSDLPNGNYHVEVLYFIRKSVTALHCHEDNGFFAQGSMLDCAAIDAVHNLPFPFFTAREGLLTANCVLTDNKITVFQASDRIELRPGFRSGSGSLTFFKAAIAPCSNNKMAPPEDDSVDFQNDNPEKDQIDVTPVIVEFKIYPNPTTGHFTVQGTATGEIQVYDLFGRLVLETPNKEIDMSTQPKGVYIVKAGEAVRKLILR